MVRPVFVLGSSVLTMNFDDNVNDESGYGNHGTRSGAAYVAGKINNGLNFDALDDYVSVPDAPSLDLTNKMTFMAWIYPTGWGEASLGRILHKATGAAGSDGYQFYIRGTTGNMDLAVKLGATIRDTALDTIVLNKWQHVAVTYDGINVQFYINGVASGAPQAGADAVVNALTLYIGNNDTGARTFDGIIDEVYIYDRALSASEVDAIYRGARVVKI